MLLLMEEASLLIIASEVNAQGWIKLILSIGIDLLRALKYVPSLCCGLRKKVSRGCCVGDSKNSPLSLCRIVQLKSCLGIPIDRSIS